MANNIFNKMKVFCFEGLWYLICHQHQLIVQLGSKLITTMALNFSPPTRNFSNMHVIQLLGAICHIFSEGYYWRYLAIGVTLYVCAYVCHKFSKTHIWQLLGHVGRWNFAWKQYEQLKTEDNIKDEDELKKEEYLKNQNCTRHELTQP